MQMLTYRAYLQMCHSHASRKRVGCVYMRTVQKKCKTYPNKSLICSQKVILKRRGTCGRLRLLIEIETSPTIPTYLFGLLI